MKFSVLGFRSDIRIKLRAPVVNPGRLAQDPVSPLDVLTSGISPLVILPHAFRPPCCFAPDRFAPRRKNNIFC